MHMLVDDGMLPKIVIHYLCMVAQAAQSMRGPQDTSQYYTQCTY